MNIQKILKGYDLDHLTIGVLGGHSALDVCAGAKKYGFRTLAVCQKGREKVYEKHYRTREATNRVGSPGSGGSELGCIDEIIVLPKFGDIVQPEIQKKLRELNTIFIHNRYFWVYCDFSKIENEFEVPIFGSRGLLKLEERDQPKNQYYLLEKAGIRTPKIIRKAVSGKTEDQTEVSLDDYFSKNPGQPIIVKVNEAWRHYERAFFVAHDLGHYRKERDKRLIAGTITQDKLSNAIIEEFVLGAQINFNYFYSPFAKEIELLGTDTRRQTSLDGFLRLNADDQQDLLRGGFKPSMIETGHAAVTVKESLLEKIYDLGEKFVHVTQKENPPGIIGPFALQGAVVAEEGKEDIVIFDVSMRIPGSPGTRFTPYSGYLFGENMSVGERIALEIAEGVKQGKLEKILT